MKNRKVLTVAGIVCAVVLLVVVGLILIGCRNANYIIPDDYLQKFENHMSHVDGSDVDYYVYKDKIIVSEESYYPSGSPTRHEHTVTLYDGLTVNGASLDDALKAIDGKQGKVVLHIKE